MTDAKHFLVPNLQGYFAIRIMRVVFEVIESYEVTNNN